MSIRILLLAASLCLVFPSFPASAEDESRYVEVTGTAELEIVPDEIHYEIEIREYFKEEFEQWAKPEDYKTKVPLSEIENNLQTALKNAGIPNDAVRVQDVGDNWRREGRDFLVSKSYDITLTDFRQIDRILKNLDTKGISSMRVGRLVNKNIQTYNEKGRVQALLAAKAKAEYLVKTLGCTLGPVWRIVEQPSSSSPYINLTSNVMTSEAGDYDSFRIIKKTYSITARFIIE